MANSRTVLTDGNGEAYHPPYSNPARIKDGQAHKVHVENTEIEALPELVPDERYPDWKQNARDKQIARLAAARAKREKLQNEPE